MEGDKRDFGRMTIYYLESGSIEHHDFVKFTREAVRGRLQQYIRDTMVAHHPIAPIHKRLVDLTSNPQTLLKAITKSKSPNLFLLKDRIQRSGLVEQHRGKFGPFDVWTLVKEEKLKVQKYRDKNGLRVIPCGHEKLSNGCRWGQIFFGNDIIGVHIGVFQGRAYVFEGNKVGYGRRTWLNQDDTVTHEVGMFEQYEGKLEPAIQLDVIE